MLINVAFIAPIPKGLQEKKHNMLGWLVSMNTK